MEFPTQLMGSSVSISKTVSEADVYLFAGITGDFARNHVDEVYMQGTSLGRRIAHGALLLGYTSRASTMMAERLFDRVPGRLPMALGFDRVRFIKPVFIGDTVTITYAITAIDDARARTVASIELRNQSTELVMVAEHVTKWVEV